MAKRSQLLSLLPWSGGLNTTDDPAVISPMQKTRADNLIFGDRGSILRRPGINYNYDGATPASDRIIGGHDFWFTNSKDQRQVSVTSGKRVFSYNSGVRSSDLFGGTAWPTTPTDATFTTINNLLIIAPDGAGNVLKKWNGTGNVQDLGGSPPAASIVRTHLGRVWCNDKNNPDRLHYSETGNPEIWNGEGDSAAIDIGVGDGDPVGITAIFPTFQGQLFVAKQTKLYRVSGADPISFKVELVSSGIGCVSHNSIAQVDQSDLVFASLKGFHSLQTTVEFGDFSAEFLSRDIQRTYNQRFNRQRLKYIKSAYVPTINSVAFAVPDIEFSESINKAIYLYNVPLKAWYRWSDVECEALWFANDNTPRFYIGGSQQKIGQALADSTFDITLDGTSAAISMVAVSGQIVPDQSYYTTKGFKRAALLYRPIGGQTNELRVQIDNFPPQDFTLIAELDRDPLGTAFTLGQSILGAAGELAPYSATLDGYGRSIVVTVRNSALDQTPEVQGIYIEFIPAGSPPETVG